MTSGSNWRHLNRPQTEAPEGASNQPITAGLQNLQLSFWERGEAGQRGQVAAEPLGEAEFLEGPSRVGRGWVNNTTLRVPFDMRSLVDVIEPDHCGTAKCGARSP